VDKVFSIHPIIVKKPGEQSRSKGITGTYGVSNLNLYARDLNLGAFAKPHSPFRTAGYHNQLGAQLQPLLCYQPIRLVWIQVVKVSLTDLDDIA